MAASCTRCSPNKLANLKQPEDGQACGVADRDGLYVCFSPSGNKVFRLDEAAIDVAKMIIFTRSIFGFVTQ
jgi:hypothetical protein